MWFLNALLVTKKYLIFLLLTTVYSHQSKRLCSSCEPFLFCFNNFASHWKNLCCMRYFSKAFCKRFICFSFFFLHFKCISMLLCVVHTIVNVCKYLVVCQRPLIQQKPASCHSKREKVSYFNIQR